MTIFLARPERVGEGIRLAVKDLFDTAGLRTSYGSILFAERVPGRSAVAVAGLRRPAMSTSGRRICTSSPTTSRATTRTSARSRIHSRRVGRPRARARARPWRLPPAWRRRRSVRIRAARSGSRPLAAASSVSGRLTDLLEGCFVLAPSFDHAGPMGRDVETCARMLAALAPGFERAELGSLEDFEVSVPSLELAEPLVRARVQEAAELFPRRRGVAFPLPEGDRGGVHARGGRVAPRALPRAQPTPMART